MKYIKPQLNIPVAAYNGPELAIDTGSNVFAARTKKGWTQAQLARKMKTLQPSIARVENGNTVPSLPFLLKIARAIGTGLVAPTFESILPSASPKYYTQPEAASAVGSYNLALSPYYSVSTTLKGL